MPLPDLASRLADVLRARSLADAADRLVSAVEGILDLTVEVGVQDVWRPLATTPGAVTPDGADGHRVAELSRPDGRRVRVTTAGTSEVTEAAAALAVAMLTAALDHLDALDAAADARQRLADNERIARVGSYDWNIVTDTNVWSDELYRIYGYEPGSFNASYERFIEMVHPDDREQVRSVHAHAYETGEPYEMEERIVRPDGSVARLWTHGEVICDESGTPLRMIGVCRDITEQRLAEEQARHAAERVREVELRRHQAMELNDNVVQGLVLLLWKLEDGDLDDVHRVAEETLDAARRMMDDLLVAPPEGPEPGSLVRREAPLLVTHRDVARPAPPSPTAPTPPAPDGDHPGDAPMRVVIADDTADLRMLLRLHLQRVGEFEVVGEAADGDEAVQTTLELRPDVVVLDLAMPTIDGLEAAARIRAAAPEVGIVVLSGYADDSVRDRVLEAGADGYVEKQADLTPLVAWLREHRTRV